MDGWIILLSNQLYSHQMNGTFSTYSCMSNQMDLSFVTGSKREESGMILSACPLWKSSAQLGTSIVLAKDLLSQEGLVVTRWKCNIRWSCCRQTNDEQDGLLYNNLITYNNLKKLFCWTFSTVTKC